jgi:hypothetical protein
MEEDIKCLISDFWISDFEEQARAGFTHLCEENSEQS